MKRFVVATGMYLLLVSGIKAQSDRGIRFEQGLSWAQIKAKAKSEKKFIFVDCFASWCGPCKAMDKDIYPSEKVGDYMNKHFISVKMQLDTAAQDNDQIKNSYGDAHQLMQDYKINAFPTFLFFSPDGNIMHRELGQKNEEDFIAISKAAMDPDKQYYSLLAKYNKGKLDTSYMRAVARAAKSFDDKELATWIANDYICRLSDKNLYAPENIWFMIEFTATTKDRGFAIFRDHADKIHQSVNEIREEDLKGTLENIIYKEEIKPWLNSKNGGPDWGRMEANVKKYDSLGLDTYNKYKSYIVFKSTIEPALKKDPDWTKIFSIIKKQHAGNGEEFLVGSSVVFYLNSGLVSGTSNDCKNFMASATYYFENYYSCLTADPLNTWAWTVFQRSSDKKDLATALAWSDSSLKLSPKANAGYMDTYGNLLYKLGRSAEAIGWEEMAVSIDSENKDIQDNLSKMKKGQNTW